MKKAYFILMLSLAASVLQSCEELDEIIPEASLDLADLTFASPVLIPPGEDSLEDSFEILIEDEELLDNLTLVKFISVRGFTYTLTDVQASPGTTITGTMISGNQEYTLTQVPIEEGTTGTITDPAFINALERDFKDDASAVVLVDGELSNDAGALFTITFQSTLTATLGN